MPSRHRPQTIGLWRRAAGLSVEGMRLDRLALPKVAMTLSPSQGDVVRLEEEESGTWFYCRIEEELPGGDLVCTVVDAQSWPSLAIGGILPGTTYVVARTNVLSVVAASGDFTRHA